MNRVKGFKAMRIVPIKHMRDARRKYGDSHVSVGFIVTALTCKTNPAGDPRGGDITNKFRVHCR